MKTIIITSIALLFCACAAKSPVMLLKENGTPPISYNRSAETQIRQSVKISFRDKEFSFQGILLFANAGETVRAAALTGFGIKIFEVEYNAEEEIFFYINNAFRNIPYFADAIRNTIRRLYIEKLYETSTLKKQEYIYSTNGWSAHLSILDNGNSQIIYYNKRPKFTVTVVDIEITNVK